MPELQARARLDDTILCRNRLRRLSQWPDRLICLPMLTGCTRTHARRATSLQHSGLSDHRVPRIHHEQQDGQIVQHASGARIRKQLGQTPRRERQHRDKLHQRAPPPGRASNAHRRDGTGHKQQRGRRHTRVVSPPEATTNPIRNDKRDTPGDRDQAKPSSNQKPHTKPGRAKKLIHNAR